jgi:hypothetical protein
MLEIENDVTGDRIMALSLRICARNPMYLLKS